MCSQRLDSLFLKSRRLQYIESNETLLGQASRLAIRPKSVVTQEVKDLRDDPGSRQGLDDEQQHSLPSTSHGKKKQDHLPRLTSCTSKGHALDPKLSLSIVSKRLFQGDLVVEVPEHRQTFVGYTGLLKKSPEATTGEAQWKRRTMELLNKAKKQMEKASNLVDTRQFQKQEVVMNTEHPIKKQQQQQQKIPEDMRRGHLGGEDDTRPIQSRGPFKYCECFSLEENTFLQGKKIKPYSRHSVQLACPLLVREQGSGEKPKPVPSGRDKLEGLNTSEEKKVKTQFLEITSLQGKAKIKAQNLLGEAKPQLLKRKTMQAMEVLNKSHQDRGRHLENSREEVQQSSQDSKRGASERNIMRPKWWPKKESWDHTVQGTPVVLAVRDHTYLPKGSKDQSARKSRLSLPIRKSSITYL